MYKKCKHIWSYTKRTAKMQLGACLTHANFRIYKFHWGKLVWSLSCASGAISITLSATSECVLFISCPLPSDSQSMRLHPSSCLPVLALDPEAQKVADLSGEFLLLVQVAHTTLERRVQPQQVLPLRHVVCSCPSKIMSSLISLTVRLHNLNNTEEKVNCNHTGKTIWKTNF